jgi:hypothetical protein
MEQWGRKVRGKTTVHHELMNVQEVSRQPRESMHDVVRWKQG